MRILVRGTNWVGDAVMTVPAIRALRRMLPDAYLALHTRPWAKDIFVDSALFDEIVPIETRGSKAVSALRQADAVRGRFDAAILLTNSFATAFSVRIAGIPKRFGYATDGRSFLLSHAVPVPQWKNERHEVYYYLNLVSEFGRQVLGLSEGDEPEPQIDIPVSSARREKAREFLLSVGAGGGPVVALGPGSTNSLAKRWGADKFAALNDRLQGELGASVVLLGSPDEADVSAAVSAAAVNKPIDITGRTTLAEAAAVLSEADLFVANDMGLAHLAPAVGTETIVVFGPTNHASTRPFSRLAEIVRAGVECSPCMLRECPIDHRCMTRVSVEQVFRLAEEKIGRAARSEQAERAPQCSR